MYDFFEIFANGEDVIGDWMKSSGKKKIYEGPEKLRIQSMNGKVSKWINDNIIIYHLVHCLYYLPESE